MQNVVADYHSRTKKEKSDLKDDKKDATGDGEKRHVQNSSRASFVTILLAFLSGLLFYHVIYRNKHDITSNIPKCLTLNNDRKKNITA